MDLGNPASYLVLADGTPVLSSDGREVGKVEHVLADADSDVFDGVIVDTARRPRRPPVRRRRARRGDLRARRRARDDAEAAEQLPEPTENPATLEADPDDTAPDDLKDKLRRAWDYLSGNY